MPWVSRAAWGARPPSGPGNQLNAHPNGSAVHWEGTQMGNPPHGECDDQVRAIQRYHMDTNGWSDIAYSIVVCVHGYEYEGRGEGKGSAANGSSSANAAWYAVCAMVGPGDPQPAALLDGIASATSRCRGWGAGGDVVGHRDLYATACPGDALYAQVHAGRFNTTGDPFMALTDAQQNDMKADTDWTQKRVAGMMPQRYYTVDDDGAAHSVPEGTPGSKPATVLDTLDGNSLRKAIDRLDAKLDALLEALS